MQDHMNIHVILSQDHMNIHVILSQDHMNFHMILGQDDMFTLEVTSAAGAKISQNTTLQAKNKLQNFSDFFLQEALPPSHPPHP